MPAFSHYEPFYEQHEYNGPKGANVESRARNAQSNGLHKAEFIITVACGTNASVSKAYKQALSRSMLQDA